MIALAALPLVWWRMVLVSAALVLVPRFWSGLFAMAPRMMAIYAGIGALVMLHWVMFYASIKLSNASVAATCMALIPVFVALIEPFLVRRRFEIAELLFGLAVIPGVALVVGGTPVEMRSGIAIGVLSALFAALFSSLNKRHISAGDDVLTVTGMELGGAPSSLPACVSTTLSAATTLSRPRRRARLTGKNISPDRCNLSAPFRIRGARALKPHRPSGEPTCHPTRHRLV